MKLQVFDTLKIQLLSLLILLKFISCLQIILDLFFIIHSLAQIKLFYLLQVEPFFNPPLQIFSAENVFHFESFSLDNLITFILNLTRFIRFSLALWFYFSPFQFLSPLILSLIANVLFLVALISVRALFLFKEFPFLFQFFLLPFKAFSLFLKAF